MCRTGRSDNYGCQHEMMLQRFCWTSVCANVFRMANHIIFKWHRYSWWDRYVRSCILCNFQLSWILQIVVLLLCFQTQNLVFFFFFQYQVYRFKGTSCFQNINKFLPKCSHSDALTIVLLFYLFTQNTWIK